MVPVCIVFTINGSGGSTADAVMFTHSSWERPMLARSIPEMVITVESAWPSIQGSETVSRYSGEFTVTSSWDEPWNPGQKISAWNRMAAPSGAFGAISS